MKFTSKPIEEHHEVPLADEGRFEQLIDRCEAREKGHKTVEEEGNACFVLCVYEGADVLVAEAQLREICGLIEAQGDRVVGHKLHRLTKPDPRTLIRSGVADNVGREGLELGADMLVIDAELSPSQTRNLEDATGLAVCDREAVILNVFEKHASSPQARAQVEIAHLQYLRPRIRGIGLNMDQQAGGIMGSRGSGETASELFARRLDDRLAEMKRRLAKFEVAARSQRKRRQNCRRIVLVGYTNAGKTSLMNALTSAGLSVRDRPFETLDTTSRCLSRHGGEILLSDTVGFIRRLPERLFASFESTLSEAAEASLQVIVLDASDPERAAHLEETQRVLAKLGAGDVPRFIVFNKIDQLEDLEVARPHLEKLAGRVPFMFVSAHDSLQAEELREKLLDAVRKATVTKRIFVRHDRAEVLREIYSQTRVLETEATEHGTQFTLEADATTFESIYRKNRKRHG